MTDTPTTAQSLAVISSTLLAMMRMLGRIEERLGHLESLAGGNSAVVTSAEEAPSQSIQLRSWDEVAQRWIYIPEPH